jgi:hypothetical protein
MISPRKMKFSRALFRTLKAKFPEIELVDITESVEDPRDVWVHLIMPEDEDRVIELREFAADKSMDILMEQGYHITIISGSWDEKKRQTSRSKRKPPKKQPPLVSQRA